MSVGSEMVLVDGKSGMVHILNPISALIWQCFDGQSSIDEISIDLAAGFGAALPRVRQDVLTMTRAAGEARLLEDVEPPTHHVDTPGGLPEGTNISLRDGRSTGRTRRALLINWSARCGFCVRILPELAALQPSLDRAGTDVVLLDGGDRDATGQLLAEHRLAAIVLPGGALAGNENAPFDGMGTPVAYLLDADGRVTGPLAYGADKVLELARSAAGLEGNPRRGDEEEGPAVARSLPVAGGVCGPSDPGGPSRQWTRAGAYSIGEYRVGIRGDSPQTERVLSAALEKYRLPEGERAPDNFSVILSNGGRTKRNMNLLLEGSSTVGRSRSPRRLLRALASHLSALMPPETGLVRLDALAAVVDGKGTLLPKTMISWLDRLQAPLSRLGVSLDGAPFAHIDLATAELVVCEPVVKLREDSMGELPDPAPGQSEPPLLSAGRYPLRTWLLPAISWPEPPLSPASAVARALGTLVGEPGDVVKALAPFASLLEQIETSSVPCESPAAFIEALGVWRAGI